MPGKARIRLRERRPDEIGLYREIHRLAYHPETHRGDEQEGEEMQDEAGTVLRLIGFLGEHAVAAGSIAAMLAVNRKLGYAPVADIAFLEKKVERPPSGLAGP